MPAGGVRPRVLSEGCLNPGLVSPYPEEMLPPSAYSQVALIHRPRSPEMLWVAAIST